MKRLLTVMAIFGTITMTAQENKFKVIDQSTVEKTITFQDGTLHIGQLTKNNDKWIVDGIWKQFDKSGRETLRVKYDKGQRVWVFKDFGDEVVFLAKNQEEDN